MIMFTGLSSVRNSSRGLSVKAFVRVVPVGASSLQHDYIYIYPVCEIYVSYIRTRVLLL